MYDAQLDEASTMQRTGHKSVNGVCTYKRSTEKFCELTSANLNQSDKLNKEDTNTKDVQTNEQRKILNRCVLAFLLCLGTLKVHLGL